MDDFAVIHNLSPFLVIGAPLRPRVLELQTMIDN